MVDGVQMPAWLERDGKRAPLAPGMELRAGDRIVTGSGARVLVKLAEGSVVKLGENGRLRVQPRCSRRRSVFKATLQVLEGAFRFTTELVGKGKQARGQRARVAGHRRHPRHRFLGPLARRPRRSSA